MKLNNTLNVPELRPCPFCGGIATYQNELGWDLGQKPEKFRVEKGEIVWGCYLKCDSCGCTLGMGCMNSQECNEGYYNTFEEAADAWNNRAVV